MKGTVITELYVPSKCYNRVTLLIATQFSFACCFELGNSIQLSMNSKQAICTKEKHRSLLAVLEITYQGLRMRKG